MKILTTESTNAEKGHFLDPPILSAFPVCHLKRLSNDRLALLTELVSQAKESDLEEIVNSLHELNRINQEYLSNQAEIAKDLNEITRLIGELQNAENELEQDFEKCDPEKITEELRQAIFEANTLAQTNQRKLAVDMRMMRLKQAKK